MLALGCSSGDTAEKKEPIILKPQVEVNENTISFKLEAKRNYLPEGEYLPDSEAFRVEVFRNKAKIWDSSEGKMFMTVIGKVKPQKKGETHIYKMTWNPEKKLTGKFTAKMIIPSKPEPYVSITEFEIK